MTLRHHQSQVVAIQSFKFNSKIYPCPTLQLELLGGVVAANTVSLAHVDKGISPTNCDRPVFIKPCVK